MRGGGPWSAGVWLLLVRTGNDGMIAFPAAWKRMGPAVAGSLPSPWSATMNISRWSHQLSGCGGSGAACGCGAAAGEACRTSVWDVEAGNARGVGFGRCSTDAATPARTTTAAPPKSHSCVRILRKAYGR